MVERKKLTELARSRYLKFCFKCASFFFRLIRNKNNLLKKRLSKFLKINKLINLQLQGTIDKQKSFLRAEKLL